MVSGAPRAAEAARGAAVDAFDASAQRWGRCALLTSGYLRSRYRTPENNSSVPMRRSSGELDVNMPPPLDSDTPLSSARALDMATAGAFTTAGVLTGSGARAPRNAAALASTHAVATDLMMHQALCLSSLRFASHLGQAIPIKVELLQAASAYPPTKNRPRDPPPLKALPVRSLRRLSG